MKRSYYSNTAYGRMRERKLQEKKQENKKECKVKHNLAPYKTIMANL